MAKLTEEHLKYLRNEEFYEQYKNSLLSRFTFSNNKLEEDGLKIEKLYAAEHADTLDDNIEVLGIIIEQIRFIYDLSESLKNTNDLEIKKKISLLIKNNKMLTEEFIIELADTINKHTDFISNGYRTTGDNVLFDGKYPIEKSKNIPEMMKKLLYDYYNTWKDLDIFEKEARFNIEFLRIHPFEDGNGRTSRLLLNYNLLIQGHAPVILPSKVKEEYFDARNREDVQWIKKLFEIESEKELQALNRRIEEYKKQNERTRLL